MIVMNVPANFHTCFLQKLCSSPSFLVSAFSDEEVDGGTSDASALLVAADVTGGILAVSVCAETVAVDTVAAFNGLFSSLDCVVDGNGVLSMTGAAGVGLLTTESIDDELDAVLLALDLVTVELGLTAVDCAQ